MSRRVATGLLAVSLLAAHGIADEADPDARWAALFREMAPLRVSRPACFDPQRWESLDARLRKLQHDIGTGASPKDRLPEILAMGTDLGALRTDCRDKARRGAEEARKRLSETVLHLQGARDRGLFPGAAGEELAALLAESRDLLGRSLDERADEWSQFEDAASAATALRQRLERVARDPCESDYQQALLAQSAGHLDRARSLLTRVTGMTCLDPRLATDARELLQGLPSPIPTALPAPMKAVPTPAAKSAEPQEPPTPKPTPASRPAPPPVPPVARAAPPKASRPPDSAPAIRSLLTLDVWQSAWGDFSELDRLVSFARANGIGIVNLNPGLAVTRDSWKKAHDRLAPLVRKLRGGGLAVNFMYAELDYPIGEYAQFLRAHRDLGIDTLIDDSEFVDFHRERFAANLQAVRAAGLRYGAFITVEHYGNSGVSDESRLWAIRSLDETILMSYFGCSLDQQKQAVEKYLRYGDEQGRRQGVKLAILLGGKSVGKEVSCERQLDEAGLQALIGGLHAWARGFASYGGIVLETNEKLPRFRVAAGAP